MAKANSLDGVADGTVMDTTNTATTGDGASFVISNGATGTALTYEADAAAYGSMGGRITAQAATSYWRWDETPGAATDRWVVHRTFVHKGTPSAAVTLAALYATGALVGYLQAWTDGTLRVSGSAGLIAGSASPALSVGVAFYACLAVTPGTTTANGRIEYKVWTVSTGAVFHTFDSTANQNLGTAALNRCRFGGLLTGQGWTEDDFDQLGMTLLAGAGNFVNPPAGGVNYSRTAADAASVIDTGSPQQIDVDWDQADTAGGADSLAKVQGLQRTAADGAGGADALQGLARTLTAAESATTADAVQSDLQLPGGFSWPRDVAVKVGQLV